MRILHILDHSIPLQSGYAFRTRAILREQRRLGWETYQLTSPKQNTEPGIFEEEVDAIRFFRTPTPSGALSRLPVVSEIAQMRATARRIEEVALLARPDVLHAHSPVLNALPALVVGRRLKIPVVYEVRAFWEDAAVDHGTNREWGFRYRVTRALETFALRHVDCVTTICEGLKRDIVARGIPETRITVIPNAVDLSAFGAGAEPDANLKRELALEGAVIVGFIGSFYAYEGLDLLLAALPRIVERMPDVRLLLVGGGPQEQALKRLAARLGIENKVRFVGRVAHQEIQRYYSIVDVFAYPRRPMRLTELVTPLKPLEAMAQGRLVVASDVGGHRELIRDGITGFLFRAGDIDALAHILERVASERGRCNAIRASAREFVEQQRSWRGSVASYSNVYARVSRGSAA